MPLPRSAVLAGLVVAPLVGCEKPAVESSPGPASSVEAPVDLGAYCQRACERAVECSIESAKNIAAKGTKHDAKTVSDAKADASKTTKTCRSECEAGGTELRKAMDLRHAERCLEQTSCETFSACLHDLESRHVEVAF